MSIEAEALSSRTHRRLGRPARTTVVFAFCWSVLSSPLWAQGVVTRVSVGSGGAQGNGRSDGTALSADGRFVAFYSDATNLVAEDTNGAADVFVRDRVTGTTTRVSVDSDGQQANGGSWGAALSADGRFVAFSSDATNLVAEDTNGATDVFLHDRATGTTTRVSVDSDGQQANGGSCSPALSADGRFVAFESDGTNLVTGDDNAARDVFVHDPQTGTTTRVSVGVAGAQGNGDSRNPVLSADGRFVAFDSYATNLVVEADLNGLSDVFLHDRLTATTTRLSGAWDSYESSQASLSADGRFAAFSCLSVNAYALGMISVIDRQTGWTTWIGWEGDTDGRATWRPSISADGRLLAYAYADAHWNGDGWWYGSPEGLMVQDIETGVTTLGVNGVGYTSVVAMSADGRFVGFQSDVDNLVEGDTNLSGDVFVRDGGAAVKVLPVNRQAGLGNAAAVSWQRPWRPETGATSDEYCYDTVDNGACDTTWTAAADGNTTAFLTGLLPAKTYFWQVRSGTTHADGGVWWSFTTSGAGAFVKWSPSPGATDQIVPTTLTWTASSDAASYEICVDTIDNNTCDGEWEFWTGTVRTVTRLKATTKYYWQVRTRTATGSAEADGGTWWSFTTSPPPPAAFQRISPMQGCYEQPASVTLTWTASEGATSYEYRVMSNFMYMRYERNLFDPEWVSVGNRTSVTLSNLNDHDGYYWQVRARNAWGTTCALLDCDFWVFNTLTVTHRTRGDLDGDGRTDLTIWRPSTGTWWSLESSGNYATYLAKEWGTLENGDIPVPGDYDGDGKTDLAFCRPTSGSWWILFSGTGYNTFYRIVYWGIRTGDVPVPGDYDGDGKTDLAFWRPYAGTWWVLLSGLNYTTYLVKSWGMRENGDTPVPGDYDGDGKTDLAFWRRSTGTWWVLESASNYTTYFTREWGVEAAGDTPVPGDYDGDGKTDLAFLRPFTGTWWVLESANNYTTYFARKWGIEAAGDTPTPGDYDGDGKTDLAFWRPLTGTWWVLLSENSYTTYLAKEWGVEAVGDRPAVR